MKVFLYYYQKYVYIVLILYRYIYDGNQILHIRSNNKENCVDAQKKIKNDSKRDQQVAIRQ